MNGQNGTRVAALVQNRVPDPYGFRAKFSALRDIETDSRTAFIAVNAGI